VPRASIRAVLLGAPAGTKKKLLGRSAKPERSITLEDDSGRTLLHVECGTDAQRQQLATAFAAHRVPPCAFRSSGGSLGLNTAVALSASHV